MAMNRTQLDLINDYQAGLHLYKSLIYCGLKGNIMANHKSATKRARQNNVRNERNRARRSKVRTFTKAVLNAISAGDKELATSSLRRAESEMSRAAGKGVYHKKTVSRTISRLSKVVKKFVTGK